MTSTTANTDARFLSTSWAAYCPGSPRALIPFLSTKHRGRAICCLSLGLLQLPSRQSRPLAHKSPNDTWPNFTCWFACVSLSFNLLHCRQKEAFQCFNLSKQYFQKDFWVKNYVKMIIQVIAPAASIKDQTNWKSLLLPWNLLFK